MKRAMKRKKTWKYEEGETEKKLLLNIETRREVSKALLPFIL